MIPKFRAWDPLNKMMITNFYRSYVHTERGRFSYKLATVNGNEIKATAYVNSLESLIYKYSHDLILMQSTGLKDKNGVEIFEGDVCNLSGGLDDYWYIVEWLFAGRQLVTYKKPDAKVSGISDGINQCYLEPSIASNLGIDGNIHENPELLSNP
ncbi:YopX family protein [Enterococcus asini]|uniref:YopX family protein n=1 Tax=Enterococcus asini TaxID=57732 RepID=UPI00266B81DF|nr:YopX family protein [Enterococcus asini]